MTWGNGQESGAGTVPPLTGRSRSRRNFLFSRTNRGSPPGSPASIAVISPIGLSSLSVTERSAADPTALRLLLARAGIAWTDAELATWQPVIDRYLAGLAGLAALPVQVEPATGFAADWE
jgi:hypothetical protein